MAETVDIGQLTLTLVDAVEAAVAVIRGVQAERRASGDGQLTGGAVLKDAADPNSYVTIADTRAQAAMMTIIAGQWPGIRVIGEEDASEGGGVGGGDAALLGNMVSEPPSRGSPLLVSGHLRHVPQRDVCVFVDPLDGTAAFVKGELGAVQVAASERGWNVSDGRLVYGALGAGVIGLPQGGGAERGAQQPGLCLAASRGSAGPVLDGVRAAVGPAMCMELPGCGSKALAVLTGEAHVAMFNLGSSLWDTCAYAALLQETGGVLTDLFGCSITHAPNAPPANRRGVLLSSAALPAADPQGRSHLAICRDLMHQGLLDALIASSGLQPMGGPQAIDIARDVHGQQLTAAGLGEAVGRPGCVAGYSVPEATAVRYKQSDAARIHLHYSKKVPLSAHDPRSVFIKRIVLRDMPYAHYKAKHAPSKLTRDVRSCQAEPSFLQSQALKDMGTGTEQGAPHLAVPYLVSMKPAPPDSPLDSAYVLLLRDFSPVQGWHMSPHFDGIQMRAALKALAYMHAFFWRGTRPGPGARNPATAGDVWPQGCYWHMGQLPAGHLDKLVPHWERQRLEFAPLLAELGVAPTRLASLGADLMRHAPRVHDALHGADAGAPFSTLIHGDPKAANFFFSQTLRWEAEGSDWLPQVGLIDFQWTGWGVASVDLAYCIAASASAAVLSPDGAGEAALLRFYHNCLLDSLQRLGVYATKTESAEAAPYAALLQQYDMAFLDLARVVVAEHWATLTMEQIRQREGKMSFNAYNKSAAHVTWLVARTAAIMQHFEEEQT